MITITQTDYTCRGGRVKCPGGLQCIDKDYMYCNGKEDCSDGSDESGSFCKGLSVTRLMVSAVNNLSANSQYTKQFLHSVKLPYWLLLSQKFILSQFHAENLSVNNYLRKNNVRGIKVRE